jgi:hypothetical protein
VNPNLAIIEEKAGDGGTLYMENIKLQIREKAAREKIETP